MKYTTDQIDQINQSISIVKYASQYLDLQQGTGKRNNEYWTVCPFHDGDVNPSMSFNEDKNTFYCLGCHSGGGLINFVQQYQHLSFPQAIEHLINYSNLTLIEKEYSNVMEFLHKENKKVKEKEEITRTYLHEDVMNRYVKEPIKEWIAEGIKQEIMDEYEVRYDKVGNRIVFPVRDMNGIVAVKGRTLYTNYKDLGIVKYIYYQPIGTNNFLFGLYKNLPYIKERKEVLVFEACKSVMLAEGYEYNNAVSLETNRINEYQMNLLLELKCTIVLCLDKGIKVVTKSKKNNKNNNEVEIGLLPKLTEVYIVEDKNGFLPDKASPVDQGKEIWEKLYKERYKI